MKTRRERVTVRKSSIVAAGSCFATIVQLNLRNAGVKMEVALLPATNATSTRRSARATRCISVKMAMNPDSIAVKRDLPDVKMERALVASALLRNVRCPAPIEFT